MEFTLNTEKAGFLIIGQYSFNFGSTTHDVDWSDLTGQEKQQFLYNYRRGLLACSTPQQLVAEFKQQGPKRGFVPVSPLPKSDGLEIKSELSPVEVEEKAIKKLLKDPIPSIKKAMANMTIRKMRKLKELEEQGKKRKSLLSYIKEQLDNHTGDVESLVGTGDSELFLAQDPRKSTQISEVVESEEEQLVFDQEVLNQISDVE